MSQQEQRVILYQSFIMPRHVYQSLDNVYLPGKFTYYNWHDVSVQMTVEREWDDIVLRFSLIKQKEEQWKNPFDPDGLLDSSDEEDEKEEDNEEWEEQDE